MNLLKKGLSEHDLKGISILRKRYRFDFTNRLVEIPLHFASAQEIIDTTVADSGTIAVAPDFVSRLMDMIADIPSGFEIRLRVTFDDMNGIPYAVLMDALQEKIEELHNSSSESKKTLCFKVIVYTLVFVVISLLKMLPLSFDYIAGVDSAYTTIIGLLLDSIASLFLCQGAYAIFDLAVARKREAAAVFGKILDIAFAEGGRTVYTRTKEDLFRYWPYRRMTEKIAYSLMLLCNGYVLTIVITEIVLFLTGQIVLAGADLYLYPLQWLLIGFITMVNTCFYFGKGTLSAKAAACSLGSVVLLAAYNGVRFLIESRNAVPFDSDNYLLTYLLLAAVNTLCVLVIRRERNRRVQHLISILPDEQLTEMHIRH